MGGWIMPAHSQEYRCHLVENIRWQKKDRAYLLNPLDTPG